MSNDGYDPYKKQDFSHNSISNKSGGLYDSTDRTFKLESAIKTQFERALGIDLSDVRIHTGPFSDIVTKKAQADAVTIGRDIYFHTGKYSPDTEDGIALLAHELQHFVHFKQDKRMVYKEDIEEIEKDADITEMMMAQMNLHNITTPVINNEDSINFNADENEDAYAYNETKEQIKDPAWGFKGVDFKGHKPVYRVYFPSTGKSYTVSYTAREKVISHALKKYRDYIDREAALLPENEREQFVIKHLTFLL